MLLTRFEYEEILYAYDKWQHKRHDSLVMQEELGAHLQ